MTDTAAEAKKYVLVNIASNVLSLVVATGVELWLTRFLIAELGVSVYGIIPLISSVIAYVAIINLAVSGSVGRFIAINMEDVRHGNIYFTSGFVGTLLTGAVVLVLAFAGLPFLLSVFDIPGGHRQQAIVLFSLVAVSSIAGAVGSPFMVSTFVRNRFYLQNLAGSLSKLIKVGIIAAGFLLFGPSLATVGIGYLLMSVTVLAASIVLTRKLTPWLTLKREYFQWKSLREMAEMGRWIILDQVGTLLYLNTDLIIINILLGSQSAGLYAPLLQIILLMQLLTPALSGVFAPVAIDLIARHDLGSLTSQTQKAVKFLGLALALPLGLICGFAGPLLQTWLGDSFAGLGPLLCLLLGPQVLFLAINPLYNINRGLNRVKVPATFTIIGGVANILISITLVKYFGLGLYGVAIGTVLSLSLRSIFFLPVYTARVLEKPLLTFVQPVFPGAGLFAAVWGLCWFLSESFDLSGFVPLVTAGLLAGTIGMLLLYTLCLKKEEKLLILSILKFR